MCVTGTGQIFRFDKDLFWPVGEKNFKMKVLTPSPHSFGSWNNDYDTFIVKRGKRILEEVNKRLYPEL